VQGALAIDNILKHGVNNLFILLDILLSKQPMVSYHFQVSYDSLCCSVINVFMLSARCWNSYVCFPASTLLCH
jgi:hypothetical protein